MLSLLPDARAAAAIKFSNQHQKKQIRHKLPFWPPYFSGGISSRRFCLQASKFPGNPCLFAEGTAAFRHEIRRFFARTSFANSKKILYNSRKAYYV
jgi:hypothetical protein